jgi:uncharacterized repeat protein (TIGR03803 family)
MMKEAGLRVWRVAILLGIAGMFTMGVSAQTEKILHRFAANGSDGYNPQFGATVVIDASGNVFGTTLFGGTSNAGTVFEIQP